MKLGERPIPEVGVLRLSGPTRFPQSQISACVARLREAAVLETISDPTDRRRTLVQPTVDATHRARHRPAAVIDRTIAAAIGSNDPAKVRRVEEALETLATLLCEDEEAKSRLPPGEMLASSDQ